MESETRLFIFRTVKKCRVLVPNRANHNRRLQKRANCMPVMSLETHKLLVGSKDAQAQCLISLKHSQGTVRFKSVRSSPRRGNSPASAASFRTSGEISQGTESGFAVQLTISCFDLAKPSVPSVDYCRAESLLQSREFDRSSCLSAHQEAPKKTYLPIVLVVDVDSELLQI